MSVAVSSSSLSSPELLFDSLKSSKQVVNDRELTTLYNNASILTSKYLKTGQKSALNKLVYVMETVTKEKQLVDMGINTFIYKDDIDTYIDSDSSETHPVKIIELKYYSREIPDEIVEVIEKTKDIFDEMFVVYTDYTGKSDKQVEAEKRSTDPILFGVFMNKQERVCIERFYYLGDWEDEYCDLTLDKMLTKLGQLNINAKKEIYTPHTLDELKIMVKQYKEETSGNISFSYTNVQDLTYPDKIPSLFKKIKTFLFGK